MEGHILLQNFRCTALLIMFGLVWLHMNCRVFRLVRAVHLQTLFKRAVLIMTRFSFYTNLHKFSGP